MDMGMPTLVELRSVEENAALCAQLGLSFVELNMNLPEFAAPERLDRVQLRRMMREQGVYFTLHLDERMDVCDFNPRVRSACLDTLRSAMELAGDVALPVLNMHLSRGVYFTLPQGKVFLYERERAHYLAALEEMRALAETHMPKGTLLCIENTDGFAPFEQEGIRMLMQSPVLALTLDTGHMHCINDMDAPLYAENAQKVKHMHLHDATRAPSRNHLPLGAGELNIAQKLRHAQEWGCRVVLEVKTAQALGESAARLPHYLEK